MHAFKKRTWGDLSPLWVAHDIRDAIMDFIAHWSERTEIRALQLVGWIGLSRSKFYSWRNRYGKANEHNTLVPRDHWLESWERWPLSASIISFRWKATAG